MRKWIIDLIYPEAVEQVMKYNTTSADGSYYEIGEARKTQNDWVGIYLVSPKKRENP